MAAERAEDEHARSVVHRLATDGMELRGWLAEMVEASLVRRLLALDSRRERRMVVATLANSTVPAVASAERKKGKHFFNEL
jgi:hypothetical protein